MEEGIIIPESNMMLLNKVQTIGGKYDKVTKKWNININWLPYLVKYMEGGMKQYYEVKVHEYLDKMYNQNDKYIDKIITETGFEGFDYQNNAVNYALNKKNVVLNIALGGGKTFCSLAIINYLINNSDKKGKYLILCPSYLKRQVWETEINKFYPTMNYEVIDYNFKDRKNAYLNDTQVKIISLETARMTKDSEILNSIIWDTVIIDEASKIKNRNTNINKLVSELKAFHKIGLTGYPIENGIEDLYGIFRFIDKSLFRNWTVFKSNFLTTDEIYIRGGRTIEVVNGTKNLDVLFEILKPYIYKIGREVVDSHLPELYKREIALEMGDEQRVEYEFIETLLKSDNAKLFDYIHKIRQAVNFVYPENSNDYEYSCKYDELLNILKEIGKGKVLVFSFYVDTINSIKSRLEANLDNFKVEQITGSVSNERRDEIMKKSKEEGNFVLCATDVLSMGFNLQHFDTIINFDLPWNPSIIENRIARVYRTGQTKPVRVYTLYCTDTFEEKILGILNKKRELIERLSKVEAGIPDYDLIAYLFSKGDKI